MFRFLTVFALVMSGVAAFGVASVANAANDHTLPPPNVFEDINPCTGELTIITETFKKSVFHFSEDANGGIHVTGTGVVLIETADGFSGRETFWFGENSGVGGGDNGASTFTFSATLGDGSGQKVVIHIVAHVTIVDGEVVVEFENDSFECLGKPAA
jgi:hypothetical protein